MNNVVVISVVGITLAAQVAPVLAQAAGGDGMAGVIDDAAQSRIVEGVPRRIKPGEQGKRDPEFTHRVPDPEEADTYLARADRKSTRLNSSHT